MARLIGPGVDFDTTNFKNSLREIKRDAEEEIVREISTELDNLLDQFKDDQSNRGRGTAASRYNNPLRGAKVVVARSENQVVIFVQHDNNKGVNVFDILDQGRDAFTSSNYMTFPVYEGQSTSPLDLEVGATFVATYPKWIKTKSVAGFEGRNYYQRIIDKVKRRLGKIQLRDKKGRFAGTINPDDVRLTVDKFYKK